MAELTYRDTLCVLLHFIPDRFRVFFNCLRHDDALIMLAPVVAGLSCSWDAQSSASVTKVTLILAGAYCLMAHVFAFNDWADLSEDSRDPSKKHSISCANGVSRPNLLRLSSLLAVTGLILLGTAQLQFVVIGFGIVLLSVFYSGSSTRMAGKQIPLLSSLLHVAGCILSFLLGYTLYSSVDARGVLIACYFGLIVAAGHLVQEARDCTGDQVNGVRTHAVRFGQRPVLTAAFVMFSVSHVYLCWLSSSGFVPSWLCWFAVLYPVLVFQFWRAATPLSMKSIQRLRRGYRVLYAIPTLGIVLGTVCQSADLDGQTDRIGVRVQSLPKQQEPNKWDRLSGLSVTQRQEL